MWGRRKIEFCHKKACSFRKHFNKLILLPLKKVLDCFFFLLRFQVLFHSALLLSFSLPFFLSIPFYALVLLFLVEFYLSFTVATKFVQVIFIKIDLVEISSQQKQKKFCFVCRLCASKL